MIIGDVYEAHLGINVWNAVDAGATVCFPELDRVIVTGSGQHHFTVVVLGIHCFFVTDSFLGLFGGFSGVCRVFFLWSLKA